MKKHIWIGMVGILLLSGCSSKSNFYQLHPKKQERYNSTHTKRATVIGIAEVEVAEYLHKSEVITRMSEGRITVHEKDLWAGSFPINDTYRIYVTIEQFDGYETGSVTLQGRWSLVNKEDNSILYSESIHYHALSKGTTLDGIVDTQSQLLERLSKRIASKLRTRL